MKSKPLKLALPGNPDRSSNHTAGWFILGLFVIVFLVFHQALSAGFLYWDDNVFITENPHFGGLNLQRLRWMFTDVEYVWRYVPLTWLGWCLTYDFFGLNPFGYHLGNLVLHGCNAGLVFGVLKQLMARGTSGCTASDSPSYRHWCAALAAAVWAVHPLRVEPVAWVTGRVYDQAMLFFLIALTSYLRALEKTPAKLFGNGGYWVAVVSLAASLLSFPTGLGFVVILGVLDFYPRRRFSDGPGWWKDATARRLWREKVPFLAVTALVLLATVLARFNTEGLSSHTATLQEFSLGARVMQAGYIWAYYLWKPWLPLDLAPVYTALISFRPTDPPFLASTAVVVLISVVLVWRRRQWPMFLALWVCHLGLLAPMLGLTEHPHYSSDRYSIMASLCWSVLVAAGLWSLRQRPQARIWAACFVLAGIAMLVPLSVRQVAVWQNNDVFFQYVIDQLGEHPQRADLYWRKGIGEEDIGKQAQALACYNAALRLYPNEARYRSSRGKLNLEMGRWAEAIEDLRMALRNHPEAGSCNLLGIALAQQEDWPAAAAQFEEALRRDPKNVQAHFNLAKVREHQHEFTNAIVHYRMAVTYQADWPEAMANLARSLISTPPANPRQLSEATQLAEKACRLTQFQQPQFLLVLGNVQAAAEHWDEAIATAQQAANQAQSLGLTNLVKQSQSQLDYYRSRQTNRPAE